MATKEIFVCVLKDIYLVNRWKDVEPGTCLYIPKTQHLSLSWNVTLIPIDIEDGLYDGFTWCVLGLLLLLFEFVKRDLGMITTSFS